ncbi:MAG: chemotaxis protein CheR [Desulfomonile tiedjei]|uniref:Chemotaxis protein CheR n=1 Tax=Desulfomonile tiedjei TaxID=2358 RepID=A0A9D6V0Y6_9BACT|nr:chemotaxis protein CheR [Desulfomonile tiedjei]
MSDLIPEVLLSKLSEIVLSNMGLHFPKEKWQDLRRAVDKAASALGFGTPLTCAEWLLEVPENESRIEALTKYLTIGETHFFRDGKLFQALEEQLIPEFASSYRASNRTLRIWSAGCATGEEPYSIAITVSRLLADLIGWNINILATDINKEFLRRAGDGVYGEWSFRSVPEGIRESYFETHKDEARILPGIKNMVRFAHHNLVKDAYPLVWHDNEPMDIIFCRNVIMYFTPERQEEIVNKLCHCLGDGGLLVVSPAEASSVTNPHLVPVNYPGVILFRKDRSASEMPVFKPELFCQPLVPLPAPAPALAPDHWAETFPDPVFDFLESDLEPEPELVEVMDVEQELTPYVEGLRLYEQGLYDEAVKQLLIEVSSNGFRHSGTATSLLTRAYANQGKLDEALAWSEKAVAADKLNAEYHHLHAAILQEMEKNQEAVVSLNRAVFLNPNLVAAHFALGNLLLGMGNRKQSDRHFKTALNILANYHEEDAVPFTEGMSAGRLTEIILCMTR